MFHLGVVILFLGAREFTDLGLIQGGFLQVLFFRDHSSSLQFAVRF